MLKYQYCLSSKNHGQYSLRKYLTRCVRYVTFEETSIACNICYAANNVDNIGWIKERRCVLPALVAVAVKAIVATEYKLTALFYCSLADVLILLYVVKETTLRLFPLILQ